VSKLDRYARRARSLGVSKARIIDAASVATGNWVRLKCQYGCGGYGASLSCPPYSPTPEYTRAMLGEYSKGLLMQLEDTDPRRLTSTTRALRRIVSDLEREIFLDGFHKAFGMASGPCELCRACDTSGPCKHPYQARPSMEACGIDVYQTARNNGFRLEVVRSEDSLCSFMALILIE
jgi:predicted metal-binding protein